MEYNLYVFSSDPGYDASDPRWVGAWWLGYLIFPCLVLSAGIFIAPFPRTMPRTWEREEEAIEMTIKTKTEEKGKENAIIGIRVHISTCTMIVTLPSLLYIGQ